MTARRRPVPPSAARDGVFDESYLSLRAKFLRLKSRTAEDRSSYAFEAAALSEKTLRTIWYESRFERRGLRTVDGRRVSIVTPGEWNLGAGPDFRGAEVRLDDETVRGDVELHLSGRGWKEHGHDADPAYDGVVLHVFLTEPRTPLEVRTSKGASVAAVCLAGRLPQPWSSLVQNFDAAGYPYTSACGVGACGQKMSLAKFDLVERLLALAADGRVLLKGRAPAAAGEASVEENFYHALMESLGFHRNKAGMGEVAARVPWSRVKQVLVEEGGGDPELVLEALFLDAAGFVPDRDPECDAETLDHIARLRRARDTHQQAPRPDHRAPVWHYGGARPHNFPQRRLAGAARLLARLCRANPSAGLFPPEGGIRRAEDFFVGPQGYFSSRARLGGARFSRAAALIGRDRAQAIWVNVYLPAAVLAARAVADAAREKDLHRAFLELPLNEPNGTARLMAHRLLGSERLRNFPITREFQQQGLIQIFQDFCDTKPWVCRDCVFPKVLDLSLAELSRG